MTTRRGRWTVRVVVASTVVAAAATVTAPGQSFAEAFANPYIWASLSALFTGALLATRRSRNPVGWLLLSFAAGGVMANLGAAIAHYFADAGNREAAGWAEAIGSAAAPTIFLIPAALLLFPNGRLLSPRWRLVLWAMVPLGVAGSAASLINGGWGGDETQIVVAAGPLRDSLGGLGDTLSGIFFGGIGIIALLSALSIVIRYRRAEGEERLQIMWLALAAGYLGIVTTVILTGGVQGTNSVEAIFLASGIAAIPVAITIAILRYRLYDINVVISKSVTYVSLAAVLAFLYGTAVVAYVALVANPQQRETGQLGVALPIGATLLVAIAFEPLRRRLQRWGNRLVYGQRVAPHEVLNRLAGQLRDTAGADLNSLAELLRDGTAATAAAIYLRVGEELRPEAAFPRHTLRQMTPQSVQDEIAATDNELRVPVRHGDDVLGQLWIAKPDQHQVTRSDEELLTDVAAGAGLWLRNLRLNAELEERARELRISRRRLVEAHDSVRHRLERDLHDGAQQQVVALKVKLGLAKTIAEREGAGEVAELLAGLAQDTDGAVEGMRRIARGIYPPLLEAEGLEPALRAGLRTIDAAVELEIGDIHRHPRPIEETIYFGVLSAVVSSHASGATRVRVAVAESAGEVRFRLESDAPYPLDLTQLRDRVSAFSGTLAVEGTAGHWTVAVDVADSSEAVSL